ncbi:unnamed protein product [Chironomus riparius]|uniref:Protein stoned-A n=1 Tax=Chironomus riparius TaxID=315576 RepID=A0A9N9RQU3_9DIPT|nr:unnamed protein product [Chironomus riparius]
MLKLPKGLKKKKKGKKSKKDQELFTEEELEQYKREHQSHPAEVSEEQYPDKAQGGGDDDEWSKFAALTTGVDSILKKTQGDLNRIKETSFFKRVPPPSQKKKEEEEKKAGEAVAAFEEQRLAKEEEKDPAKELLKAVVELSESEEESDVDDSAFDTTFIERVEAGELPLAYVEAEEEEPDLGPDPFDTGYAEKIIKGPEVSQRGKRLVNIGAAVEVLTGKVEASVSASKSRRQRRGIQNLLLESFELNQEEHEEATLRDTTSKTLLDEPADLAEDFPIDLSVSLHLAFQPPKPSVECEELDKDLEEFDIIRKDDNNIRNTETVKESEETVDWSEFELEREKPLRSPPPSNLKQQISDEGFELTDDPFDTAYVEKIVPKSIDYDDDFDPRGAVEEEDDFNPRAEQENLFDSKGKSLENTATLRLVKNDLLSASHSDLASIAPTLAPTEDSEPEEVDPFDTSAVDSLVAPGKFELKYLERELLDSEKKKESLSDDDFDPRAEEEQKPSAESLKQRKSSLSLHIPGSGSKLVSFIISSPDLLHVDSETSSKIQKPLTPYYRESALPTEDEVAEEEDPFDTSFVPEIAPTKVELDIIEKEILKVEHKPTLKQSLSDPDFDPRAITPEPPKQEYKQTDLFLTSDTHDIKVLTPAKDSTPEEVEVDPFDTSIANNIVPGRTELKLLEDELIEKKPEALLPTDILSDTQDNSIYVKILTPQPTGSLDLDNEEDFDPFDTSFATSNLAPGETEIKLIESELIN